MNKNSSWIDALGALTDGASDVIGAIRSGPARTVTAQPARTQTNWTLIAMIGAGVVLVIGLIYALKK